MCPDQFVSHDFDYACEAYMIICAFTNLSDFQAISLADVDMADLRDDNIDFYRPYQQTTPQQDLEEYNQILSNPDTSQLGL